MPVKPLAADRFRLKTDPTRLPFASTVQLPEADGPVGQERAMRAIAFALRMAQSGYNIHVSGAKGSGKHRATASAILRAAQARKQADDWVYVHNFAGAQKPLALRLAAGEGALFKQAMGDFASGLKTAMPRLLATGDYRNRKAALDADYARRSDRAFEALRQAAAFRGLALVEPRDGRFEFRPERDGLILRGQDFRSLPRAARDRIAHDRKTLRQALDETLAGLAKLRMRDRGKLDAIEREMAAASVAKLIEPLRGRFSHDDTAARYLDAVRADALGAVPELLAAAHEGREVSHPPFHRYAVNLLTDNSRAKGAPVVWLGEASHGRLIGRIERVPVLATKLTDFMFVRAGALHEANGGFLLAEVADFLRNRAAWLALKRCLRERAIVIENLPQAQDRDDTLTIAPAAIPLDVKVVLFGEPLVFERMRGLDPDFAEMFKIQAEFASTAERDDHHCTQLLRSIASHARRTRIRQFDRTGAARLIDEASRMAGDAEKISIRVGRLFDLVRESDSCAAEAGRGEIASWDIERALAAKDDRAGRLKALEQEMIRRRILLIDTEGEVVGQVNALTVVNAGGGSFGAPARITARTGPGASRGIHIERLANYVGLTHRRGVQTLSAYLNGAYSGATPLSLSASVAFEQCYGPIDGDSASAAELIAILSAIAEVPVRQSIGITGSIDQNGALQPVGGINQKIEGFFDVCVMRGLTAGHGVIIPMANAVNLMLREDVVDAARRGLFAIYAVENVGQAIEVLTGMRTGGWRGKSNYPRGSFNRLVAENLLGYARPRVMRPLRLGGWW